MLLDKVGVSHKFLADILVNAEYVMAFVTFDWANFQNLELARPWVKVLNGSEFFS